MGTKIGLLLPSREVVLWAGGDVGRLVDAAVTSKASGFDSVWVGDSLLARPRSGPLITLAAVAARTTRLLADTSRPAHRT